MADEFNGANTHTDDPERGGDPLEEAARITPRSANAGEKFLRGRTGTFDPTLPEIYIHENNSKNECRYGLEMSENEKKGGLLNRGVEEES